MQSSVIVFQMRNDVEYFKVNGAPTLKKIAWPHRNLTQNEIQLQAKLDKLNWSCFVPSCGNQRLMADKKLVFFPVPEGKIIFQLIRETFNFKLFLICDIRTAGRTMEINNFQRKFSEY